MDRGERKLPFMESSRVFLHSRMYASRKNNKGYSQKNGYRGWIGRSSISMHSSAVKVASREVAVCSPGDMKP